MTLQELEGLKEHDKIICKISLSGQKVDEFISYKNELKEVIIYDLTHKNELKFDQDFILENFEIKNKGEK